MTALFENLGRISGVDNAEWSGWACIAAIMLSSILFVPQGSVVLRHSLSQEFDLVLETLKATGGDNVCKYVKGRMQNM